VHVHIARLRATEAVTARFGGLLTRDEQERAARFRFPHLRSSFVLARGALRILAGGYLNTDPAGIRFQYGPKGKPCLAGAARLRFNVSHSGALALFAFTLDVEIGVDVEEIRPMPDLQQIAAGYFSAAEAAELVALPAERREAAFFRCWTRKEAYVKALGEGLSSTAPESEGWTLHDLDVPGPYAAALAYLDDPRALEVLPAVDASLLLDPG